MPELTEEAIARAVAALTPKRGPHPCLCGHAIVAHRTKSGCPKCECASTYTWPAAPKREAVPDA